MSGGIFLRILTTFIAMIIVFFMTASDAIRSAFNSQNTTTSQYYTTSPSTEHSTESSTSSTTESTTESTTVSTTESTTCSTTESTTKQISTTQNIYTGNSTTENGSYVRKAEEIRKLSFGGTLIESATASTVGSDGAYYCCGEVQSTNGDFKNINSTSNCSPSSFIARIKRGGPIEWIKVKGDSIYKYYYSCMTTLSNGNIAVGGYQVPNTPTGSQAMVYQAFVHIYDSTGKLVSSKYPAGIDNTFIYSITATSDGYIIGGATSSHTYDFSFIPSDYTSMYAYAIKYGLDGTKKWTKSWGGTTGGIVKDMCSENDNIFIAIQTTSNDGDFAAFSGLYGTVKSDTVVLKLNSEGALQWSYVIATSLKDDFCHLAPDGKGGCLVAGNVSDPGLKKLDGTLAGIYSGSGITSILLKLNSSGKLEWDYTLRGNGDDTVEDVCSFTGGFAVVGRTTSTSGNFSVNNGEEDGFVALFTPSGKLVSCINNGGSDNDIAMTTVYANGYLMVFGNSNSTDLFFKDLNSNVSETFTDSYGNKMSDIYSAKYKLEIG